MAWTYHDDGSILSGIEAVIELHEVAICMILCCQDLVLKYKNMTLLSHDIDLQA